MHRDVSVLAIYAVAWRAKQCMWKCYLFNQIWTSGLFSATNYAAWCAKGSYNELQGTYHQGSLSMFLEFAEWNYRWKTELQKGGPSSPFLQPQAVHFCRENIKGDIRLNAHNSCCEFGRKKGSLYGRAHVSSLTKRHMLRNFGADFHKNQLCENQIRSWTWRQIVTVGKKTFE